ncbi:MAG: TolC family protein [Bacteroidota bacterium]
MTRLLLLCCMISVLSISYGQDSWSLQSCIKYAWDNNLTVQQAELNTRNFELTERQSKFQRLPTVNGSTTAGYQFGRTIDPTTNTFNNTRIGFNSFGVNGSVLVFDGNRINSQVQQSKYDVQAAKLDAENTRQTVALSVATAYLNILLGEEQLVNAQTQRRLSEQQLERTARLVEVGQLAPNARLDLEAQVARNEQQIIEAQNAVDIAYLNLKQLLQFDPTQELVLERPEVTVEEQALVREFTVAEVYQAALQSQATVGAAEARLESSKVGEKVAASGNLPTLSLFGSLNTNYSSVAPDFDNPNTDNAELVARNPIPVEIGGQEVDVVFFDTEGITFPTVSYNDQLNENFGQGLGVSLNVPIYNNHRNTIAKERARLNTISAEVTARQVTDQLKTDVQAAITGFRASRNAYQAAERSLNAADAAFNDAQRRFDVGAINSFEYNNAVDNLDVARREMTRAKYQLLFNMKVVDFYLGQPL